MKLITQGEGCATHAIAKRAVYTGSGLAHGKATLIAECNPVVYAREDGLGFWKLIDADDIEAVTCRTCRRLLGLSLPARSVSDEDREKLRRWEAG